ncbi:MAG: ribosomal protein methylthiotransferase, partial [Actinomycetota bacterium]|nr:ribosomal protein methylthiotransferase [Actinomycetota bacterium]
MSEGPQSSASGADLVLGTAAAPWGTADDPGTAAEPGTAPETAAEPGTGPAPGPRADDGPGRSVTVVTLGCARNEVDSEELAGRLSAAGWTLCEDAEEADVVVVNTCGFVEQAAKDSIDTLLEAVQLRQDPQASPRAVVAVGCLAERHGVNLAQALPEADAVLGFDTYEDMATHLRDVLDGRPPASHTPRDRRELLPLAPAHRQNARPQNARPQDARPRDEARPPVRLRLTDEPWAPLKIASGCDRRCTFCAIPTFRGAHVSRPGAEILAEAGWLVDHGVRELLLVSENTTSYGKDLCDPAALEDLLPRLTQVPGLHRVRVSYLQPAELRPGLTRAIATTPGVAPYFDLSFQHASPSVLRRMRRFGGTDEFLELIEGIRALAPEAGLRSNVIVGFPGETEDDFEQLRDFLVRARLDTVGVFAYSDEEGTAAADLDGKCPADLISRRVEDLTALVQELMDQRSTDRIGRRVR